LATRQTDSRARPRKAAPRRAAPRRAGRQAVRQSMSTAIRRAAVGRLIDRRPPLPAQHRPPARPSVRRQWFVIRCPSHRRRRCCCQIAAARSITEL